MGMVGRRRQGLLLEVGDLSSYLNSKGKNLNNQIRIRLGMCLGERRPIKALSRY